MSDVTIGNGNGTYNVSGSQGGTITVGNGNDTVAVTGGNGQTITIGNGNDSLTVTGATADRITAGNGNDTVVVNGGSGQTITIGNGNDTLTVTGATGDTITAGNGNDRITVSGGAGNTIVVGNGNETVVASADHNDTITVGNGNDTVYLGANDTVTVGKGNDLVVLPSSTPTLGAPASITVLEDHSIGMGIAAALSASGFGQEKIYGFATNDQIEVSTSQFANYAAVLADARQVGQNTVITADASDTITLENFQLANLKSGNVVFVNGGASATVSLTISGLPFDATLSSAADPGGVTYNATTHVWTVAAGALADLTLHAGEVTGATLLVTATDSATGYSVSQSVALTVNPVAPTLTAPASLTVTQGHAVALNIGETPYDPRDVVALKITGVPADATLSAGTRNSDGSWTLTPPQLSGLTLTAGAATTTSLTVTATNTLGITASTSDSIALTVTSASTIGVAVTGTAQEGQALSAVVTGAGGQTLTYQWQSSADGTHWNNIATATSATYLVQEGDETDRIRVQVTPAGGSATASAATAAVLDAPPTVTTPVITGTAQEGKTLTAAASAGQSDNPVTYAWYSSADGYSHAIDSGAAHLVTKADEGFTIEVRATATNDNGVSISAISAATGRVLDAAPTVTTPTIAGTAQAGQTLTASADGGDNSVSYAWYSSADGFANTVGTGTSYQLKEGDEGFSIEVRATSTNADGVSTSATSSATGPVLDAAPTITTPTITGTAQEGQTLTASATAGESDNSVSYQWQANGANITGATGATYVVQEGDEGKAITVTATATNDNGVHVSATSAATSAVLDAAPTVTTPTITGTAQEGQTLTASASSGEGDDPVSYQWQANGANITGATGATYVVQEGDEGKSIAVTATATNDDGVHVSATSAATSAVLDAAPTITTPTITGTAQEGQTLTASASSGQGDNPVGYQWQVNGANITGATGATYVVQEGDEGKTITVTATATNDNGVTISATSAATSAVLDAAPTVTTPTITGTAQEGQTLTASASSGEGDDPVSYQWQANGTNITGATGTTYVVQEGDEGKTITVTATATNDNGVTVSATSAATSAVLDAAPTITTPTITGPAQEGQTLTASASSGQGDNPVSYQWQANGANITGATGSTYVVQEGDEGKTITVTATATNDDGVTISATSSATSAVLDAAPTVTTPTITGTAQEGQTLTASASSGQGDNPVGYQWQANGANITGATGTTYVVQEGDEGKTITVTATATNDNGVHVSATSAATGPVLDAAPTVTTPTITGTAQEGQTLSVSANAGQSDNPVTYAWYSSADNFTNPIGNGSTYLVKEGDEGFTIEAKATATNDNGLKVSATSAATAAVLDAAPTVTTPIITGIAQEGQTLSVSASAGQSDNPVTYAWYSSADNFTNPIGTGSAYTVKEADEGFIIEAKATVTNDNGVHLTATSAATATVIDNASVSVSVTQLAGSTPQEGETLVATATVTGDADAQAAPVTYQWQSSANGGLTWTNVPATTTGQINGVLSSLYQLGEGDEGKIFRATASITDDTGHVFSATSAQTSAVGDVAAAISLPFSYAVDDFKIVKGTSTFDDNFTSGPPPVGGLFGTNIAAFSTSSGQNGSTWSEVNGKAVMSAGGAVAGGVGTIVQALLLTNTAPQGTGTGQSNLGLKQNSTFTVSATLDLAAPVAGGGGYGILLTNTTPGVTGTELVELEVQRSSSGTANIVLLQVNQATNTNTVLANQVLTAGQMSGNTQIELDLAHNTANSSVITGSFELFNSGTQTAATTFAPTTAAHAFNSQTFTRADIFATAAAAAQVTGTAQEGKTLTASAVANDSDAVLSYQWQRSSDGSTNWINVSGATGSTYVVQEADENNFLRVSVTSNDSDNPGNTATAVSSATAKVIDAAPTVTVPIITGTAQAGQTLTASATAGDPDNTIAYAWFSSQSNFTVQIGSGPTYVVQQADQGSQIEVKATATNDNGITASTTSAVTVLTLSVTAPIIAGAPQEGQTLTASATPSDPTATVTYAWYSSQSGFTIQIGTGASYLVQEVDEGHTLEVKATASKGALTASATSVPTSTVVDAAPTVTTPTISGIAQEGQTLTASASAGDPDNTITYAWYSSRTNDTLQIGSGPTYVVQEAEEGYTISVQATATNDNHVSVVSAMSAPTGTVHDAPPTVTTPIITGTAQEGQTLNAFASAGQLDNPVTYAWYNGSGAEVGTGPSYQVQESDEGNPLTVVATATNDDGLIASQSASTAMVVDAPPQFATFPTISGTQREGETLTVSATPVDGDNFVTYTWYSSADSYDFPLSLNDSYTLTESDEAHQIEVVATVTNQQGVTISATSNATGWILDQLPSVATPTLNNYSPFEGEVLTASVNPVVQDADDPSLVYLWYSSRDNYQTVVGGGETYLVQEADEGYQIGVRVVALDDYPFLSEDTATSPLVVTNRVPDDGDDNDPSLNGAIIQSHQYFNVSHADLTLSTHSTVVGFDNIITPDDNVLTLPEHSDGDTIVGFKEHINVNYSGTAFTGPFRLDGTGDVITGSWNDILVDPGNSVTLIGTANTIDGDNVTVTVNDAIVTLTGDGDTLSGQNDIVVLRGDNAEITGDSQDIIIDPGLTVTLDGTNNTISGAVDDHIIARGLSNVVLINGGTGDLIDGVGVTVTATGNDFTLRFPDNIVKGSSNTIRLDDVSWVEIDAVGFNTVYGDYETIVAPNQAGQTALVLMGSNDAIAGNNLNIQMLDGTSATLDGNQDQVYGTNELLYVNNETVNLGGSNGGPLVGDTIVGSNNIVNLSVPNAPTGLTNLTVQGSNNKVFGNNENITIGDGAGVELNGVFGDTITFATGVGTLVLDQSATFNAGFANSIVGFSGSSQLDLRDLVYNGNTTAHFAEDPDGTGGTLTVTNGGFPSAIVLVGDYSTTNFAVASDGHGGTLVTTHP